MERIRSFRQSINYVRFFCADPLFHDVAILVDDLKLRMKDTYSKVEISKTDLTTGKELEGAKLQILNKEGEVLEEWVTDGKTASGRETSGREELLCVRSQHRRL